MMKKIWNKSIILPIVLVGGVLFFSEEELEKIKEVLHIGDEENTFNSVKEALLKKLE
jgi:hypothetical protein